MSIDEIEEDLNTLKPIKFKDGYKPLSLKEVIKDALRSSNNSRHGLPTYHLNNRKQCGQQFDSRLRGIADLYRLSKNYYPNTKLKDVLKVLKTKYHQECCTTNQSVYLDQETGNEARIYNRIVTIRLSNRRKVNIAKEFKNL